jgi:Zn-dependent peptidase ImmA (M78 family)
MKIDFDKTIRAAARLRGHLGLTDPETICRALDLQILRLPLGTSRNSIKGFIQRSARCYTIVVNSDLSALLQDIILFHEIGHYWLGHMDASVCTFHDSGFAYSLTSALENEANSFVAEYLLDTDETLMVLQESDTFQHAASRLHVPPEILDFKWRMLVSRSLLDRSSPCPVQSDCLKQIDYAGTVGADIP